MGLLKQKRNIIMQPVKLTKGEKLIEKINMVFSLLQARRDDTAAVVLQQVLDELREIK
tara:strand:+ start:211 stop:384 length:174 start_codon:yes stop_codon:yes gene_type:complete